MKTTTTTVIYYLQVKETTKTSSLWYKKGDERQNDAALFVATANFSTEGEIEKEAWCFGKAKAWEEIETSFDIKSILEWNRERKLSDLESKSDFRQKDMREKEALFCKIAKSSKKPFEVPSSKANEDEKKEGDTNARHAGPLFESFTPFFSSIFQWLLHLLVAMEIRIWISRSPSIAKSSSYEARALTLWYSLVITNSDSMVSEWVH